MTSHPTSHPDQSTRLPVHVTSCGPLDPLAIRVHEMAVTGQCREALGAADDYERLARAAGDPHTVAYLVQARMYALFTLGQHAEALVAAQDLLALHRAEGASVSEAKTQADLADCLIAVGRLDEGLHALARATWLLDSADPNHERYASAVHSVSEAAHSAQLYEVADALWLATAPIWARTRNGATSRRCRRRPSSWSGDCG